MPAERLLDSYVPYLLQRADHLLSARFHRVLQEAGIEVSEWRVLAVLRDRITLSVQELARVALLPQPTTSHACRRLEDNGLLRREESAEDRRRRMLCLTADGEELITGLVEQARALAEKSLASVTTDPAHLVEVLQRLIDELDAPDGG